MQTIQITGGTALHGEIRTHGAKNAILPILAATVACRGQFRLHNCPMLQDVENTLQILRALGCRVKRSGDTVEVDSSTICHCEIPRTLMRTMRSSILFMGALIGSCAQAELYLPGGCVLGDRPVDLHLTALRALGAQIEQEEDHLWVKAPVLHGAAITLTYPSVGATENLILTSLNSHGAVTIYNAAKEPEIVDLSNFLIAMGAQISGAGSAVIQIEGGRKLHGTEYTVMPDRIEAATFLCAAAACGGDVVVENVVVPHQYAVIETLLSAGTQIEAGRTSLHIRAQGLRAPRPIRTAPYPGFPTDAQALLMAALLKAEGITLIEETVFDNRFRHVEALQAMGADIQVANHIARIRGVRALHGADVTATDLRGAAAMVVAALSADGQSQIRNIGHLLRGYEGMDQALRQLGAEIYLEEIL